MENLSEIVAKRNEEIIRIIEVNSLLRRAFGRRIPFVYGIKGNFENYCDPMWGPRSVRCLEAIHKTFLFGGKQIGTFTERDGSAMEIFDSDDVENAQKYARLFKEKYGKDVAITVGASTLPYYPAGF